MRLTPEELAQRERDGYVLRERVFTRDELAEIIESCEQLVADLVKDRNGRRYKVGSYVFEPDALTDVTIKWEGDSDAVHGIEPFAHLSPDLTKWAYDPRFIEPSVDFVGDDSPVLFTEKLNLKRPNVGGPNPWHQDFPYWADADDRTRVVTALLFLDDATLENGTLQVIPGSHTQGQWPLRTDADAFGNLEMDPAAAEGHDVRALEVPAGSVVFFGPFLVHKSEPNRSDKDRRALLFSYQPSGMRHALDIWAAQRANA
jgi:ectoine hydroxylase